MIFPAIITDSLNLQMTALLQHFAQYPDLSDDLEKEIINRVNQQTFKKGELIHDANKIGTHSYFIQQERLRMYFIHH